MDYVRSGSFHCNETPFLWRIEASLCCLTGISSHWAVFLFVSHFLSLRIEKRVGDGEAVACALVVIRFLPTSGHPSEHNPLNPVFVLCLFHYSLSTPCFTHSLRESSWDPDRRFNCARCAHSRSVPYLVLVCSHEAIPPCTTIVVVIRQRFIPQT